MHIVCNLFPFRTTEQIFSRIRKLAGRSVGIIYKITTIKNLKVQISIVIF